MGAPRIPTAVLPPLYAVWMEQFLVAPIPEENEATCAACAMLSSGEDPTPQGRRYFRPAGKCCTYMPQLPNYLVGRILMDPDPASEPGRMTVERRLGNGVAVTPLGLGASASYSLLYEESAPVAFGRSERMRCPHYLLEEGGRCGIWRHRNSVCATWFCKYNRGSTGNRFWLTLLELLGAIETGVSEWCLNELGLGFAALRELYPLTPGWGKIPIEAEDLDGVVDPAKYRAVWGEWWGREREFYARCASLVAQLPWDDVLAICGARVRLLARLTQAAYEDLVSTEIPFALRSGPIEIHDLGVERCCVSADGSTEVLDVPRLLLDVLHYFDGRPYREVVQAIEVGENVKLHDSLVRKLVDFGILVPSQPALPRAEAPATPAAPRKHRQ